MNEYYNFYTPKNNVYIIKNENGEVEKIIGSEGDELTINAIGMMNAYKEITPLDIQKAIKDFYKKDLEKEVKE